jgi:hypothetical protein
MIEGEGEDMGGVDATESSHPMNAYDATTRQEQIQ